eukprot:CAMPEP_0184698566 /NCGR_PEP_ID=MMETSP0313-20130426/5147_1 /TAXON_ID=2792 /ORGANISM="Porphyridium aerugineum, Strain SAG 1380-2" /LENGTH=673 /DNA_ID=CAMNT_0027157529 /DNA_START=372 /DNA_END=2393 /DNA_ORIENTATION=-
MIDSSARSQGPVTVPSHALDVNSIDITSDGALTFHDFSTSDESSQQELLSRGNASASGNKQSVRSTGSFGGGVPRATANGKQYVAIHPVPVSGLSKSSQAIRSTAIQKENASSIPPKIPTESLPSSSVVMANMRTSSGPVNTVVSAAAPFDVGGLSDSSDSIYPLYRISLAGGVDSRGKTKLTRILILMSDTGGGHRASAEALKIAFEQQFPGMCEVVMKDFWVEMAGGLFKGYPKQYAFLAKYPFLWKSLYVATSYKAVRTFTDFATELLAFDRVRSSLEEIDPDVIISVHPLVQELTLEVLKYWEEERHFMSIPFITVVTDYGSAHPTWFHPSVSACYIPSEPIREIALEQGLNEDQVKLFGLPVRAPFWQESRSISEIRTSLKIKTNLSTVLLVGGGDGVGGLGEVAGAVADALAASKMKPLVQVVIICGKNKVLADALRVRRFGVSVFIMDFVDNMHEWMRASDIIITKAGPGTIAEALICGLPIILSSFLPGQEEGNVRFVVNNELGAYSDQPEEISQIVCGWLADPESLAAMRNRVKQFGRPRATQEIARDAWSVAMQKLDERDKQRTRLAAARERLVEEKRERRQALVATSNNIDMVCSNNPLGSCMYPFREYDEELDEPPTCLLFSRMMILFRQSIQALLQHPFHPMVDSVDRDSSRGQQRIRTE